MHSLPIGRILEIYFAQNERKSHVNFAKMGEGPVYIFTKQEGVPSPRPPVAPPLVQTILLFSICSLKKRKSDYLRLFCFRMSIRIENKLFRHATLCLVFVPSNDIYMYINMHMRNMSVKSAITVPLYFNLCELNSV